MSLSPFILVVNHDIPFVEMIGEVLEEAGYTAAFLHEGQEAFELIKRCQPQLVILEMLILDPEAGWLVLNKMRLDPQTTNIPVIIASTATDLMQRNEANLRAKHCDILLKPFDLKELLLMVGKYAPLERSV